MAPIFGSDKSRPEDNPTEAVQPRVGDFALTRDLGRCLVVPAQRFLALHPRRQTSHVAYRFDATDSRIDLARFEAVYDLLSTSLDHPHILRLEELRFVPDELDPRMLRPWVIAPFAGDADGLRPLSRLLRQKGGQLNQIEAEQAIAQILSALEHAHDPTRGRSPSTRSVIFHGPLGLDEVLVDRHGRVVIELLGFGRRLRGLSQGNSETVRDEIVRVCEIAYELLTGLRAEAPLIPAPRLVPRLDKAWIHWLRVGLDPSRGFESASAALAALPSAIDRPEIFVAQRTSVRV